MRVVELMNLFLHGLQINAYLYQDLKNKAKKVAHNLGGQMVSWRNFKNVAISLTQIFLVTIMLVHLQFTILMRLVRFIELSPLGLSP
jgi:hypothetical protein